MIINPVIRLTNSLISRVLEYGNKMWSQDTNDKSRKEQKMWNHSKDIGGKRMSERTIFSLFYFFNSEEGLSASWSQKYLRNFLCLAEKFPQS